MVVLAVPAEAASCDSVQPWRVPEVKVDVLDVSFFDSGSGAIETGRYLDGIPTLLLSDGAMDGA